MHSQEPWSLEVSQASQKDIIETHKQILGAQHHSLQVVALV